MTVSPVTLKYQYGKKWGKKPYLKRDLLFSLNPAFQATQVHS